MMLTLILKSVNAKSFISLDITKMDKREANEGTEGTDSFQRYFNSCYFEEKKPQKKQNKRKEIWESNKTNEYNLILWENMRNICINSNLSFGLNPTLQNFTF